jgi:putative transposase
MMSDLRSGDKLALPNDPKSYWEVLDGRSHAGTIHIFDAAKRAARYVDEAGIRAGISDGSLVLHRKGMPRVGIPAQYDNTKLHARVRLLHGSLRRIAAIQAQLDLSFAAAIPKAREDYQKENSANSEASPFPSPATLFRAREKQLLGLPVLKGDKNKGNHTPRYSGALVDFIHSAIRDNFLVTESKWTVLGLTGLINRESRRQGLYNQPQIYRQRDSKPDSRR